MTHLDTKAIAPLSPEGKARLRATAERALRDDADEDLDHEKWGEACSPWDVLSLLNECHGRRFDPNLVARVEELERLLSEALTFLDNINCDGCAYEDNCPGGARHYVCLACQASREAARLRTAGEK